MTHSVPQPPELRRAPGQSPRRERRGRGAQVQAPAPAARPVAPRSAQPTPPRPVRQPGTERLAQALAQARAWARPASTGVRLGAFLIDLALVLLVGASAWVLAASPLLGAIAAVEVAVILGFLEARTGATLGNVALRIRTVRDDSPYSPGVARGAVRALIIGAATIVVPVVGGIAIVATSAVDPMRMGRSWADRAARTLVVRVPTAAERAAWAHGAAVWAANPLVAPEAAAQSGEPERLVAPGGGAAPVAPSAGAASVPVAPVAPVVSAPGTVPASVPAPAPAAAQVLQPERVRQEHPEARNTARPGDAPQVPSSVVPVDAPIAPPQPVREVVVGEQLLLTFDTGQRLQLPIPFAANLGRRPEASEQEDRLCAVSDPDGTVSKTHLRIECRGESVWVMDLGSTNGSAVIDETGAASRLDAGARMRLEEGTRVRIGDRMFTVATVIGEFER